MVKRRTSVYALDGDDVIVRAGDGSHPSLHDALGLNVWGRFPGLREAGVGPLVEAARSSGNVEGRVVFYAGVLAFATARSVGDEVEVEVEDVPLDGLREALDAAEAWLGSGGAPLRDARLERREAAA